MMVMVMITLFHGNRASGCRRWNKSGGPNWRQL